MSEQLPVGGTFTITHGGRTTPPLPHDATADQANAAIAALRNRATSHLPVGIHDNIPAAVYHADPCERPSLSSSVARVLVEQTPLHAWLAHPKLGGKRTQSTDGMDFGAIIHAMLSGLESEMHGFALSPYDDYRSKDARAWRDAVTAEGRTPVKQAALDAAGVVAGELRNAINKRGDSLNPFEHGRPEVTAIWEESGGVLCRARYDRLVCDPSGFADIWDWKTTGDVSPDALARTIIDHGYHIQAAFYLRGARALLPEYRGRFSFLLAFVEKDPPHVVRVVPMTESWLHLGNVIVSRAISRWSDCITANTWPSGTGENCAVEPPSWYAMRVEEMGLSI
jgi:hypothetical protein